MMICSKNVNIDEIIKQVETIGVQYIGVYISSNSKELLNLKIGNRKDRLDLEKRSL